MNIKTTKAYIGWYAVDDDVYDGAPDTEWPGCALGHGTTQKEAIEDLLWLLDKTDPTLTAKILAAL